MYFCCCVTVPSPTETEKNENDFIFIQSISHSPHANELIHTKVLFTHSHTHRYYILTQYALDFNPSLLYNVSKPLALLPRRPPITQRHHDALLL